MDAQRIVELIEYHQQQLRNVDAAMKMFSGSGMSGMVEMATQQHRESYTDTIKALRELGDQQSVRKMIDG